MMWTTLALFAAVSLAPNEVGQLKLDHVRSTHGVLGPARAEEKYVPGDSLTLNFDIDGITADEKGKVLYSIAIEVTNLADKSVLFRQAAQDLETISVFGGNRVQGFAHLDLGTEVAPGEYTMKVTVTDRASKAARDLTHPFTVAKPDFAVVRIKTTSDQEGNFPAPALGQGQVLWFNYGIVGFGRDAKTKQPSIQFEFNVLDDAGKPTLAKPIVTTLNKDVPEKNRAIPMQFPLSLTRAGKFTIEAAVTDLVTKKTTRVVLPLNVLAIK